MTSPPSSELGRAGQLVAGKFRLDAMIGRGGMGSVWSATHVGLGHRLAIKLIAREYVRSPEALRRFEAEAKAAARLQSRHVVQVFDNGTLDDGTPFIAMELLAGENLSARIENRGPIGLGNAVEILAQCCKALGRAHAAGIVHRDIKPDNIFLAREPDDEGDVAKILDFGVAKMALELEGASQATGTGVLLGTPLYMSPEQVRGARDVDQRADLYALGLVAYTMLTARVAIAAETFGDIVIKICTQPLPSLLAFAPPGLPPSLETWFHKACAREASDRYQSAQELIDALRAASGTSTRPSALPVPQPAPTLESAAMRPAPVALPFATSEATAPTLAAPGLQSGAVDLRRGSPQPLVQSAAAVSVTAAGLPAKSRSALVWTGVLTVLLAVGALLFVLFRPGDPRVPIDPSAAGKPADSPVLAATTTAPAVSVTPPVTLEEAGSSSPRATSSHVGMPPSAYPGAVPYPPASRAHPMRPPVVLGY